MFEKNSFFFPEKMKKYIVDVIVVSVVFVFFLYHLYPVTSCEIKSILLSPFYSILYNVFKIRNPLCEKDSLRYIAINEDLIDKKKLLPNFGKMLITCGILLLFIVIYNVIQIVLYQDLPLWLKIFLYTTMTLVCVLFLIQILKYGRQTKNYNSTVVQNRDLSMSLFV